MSAIVATEANGVEYLFTETSGNSGGTSSDWQSNSAYIMMDSSLFISVSFSLRR